jgi:hypothetical protein
MTGKHTANSGAWGAPKSEEARKLRARMRARYHAEKAGKVHKFDGKDIDHKTPLSKGGAEDAPSNLRVRSRKANRSVWGKGGVMK